MTDPPFAQSFPSSITTETSDDICDLIKAMSAFQASVVDASKDVAGQIGTKVYFYADLASVWKVCREGLGKHGLAVIQTAEVIEGQEYTCTLLGHESGQWIKGRVPIIVETEHRGINNMQAYGAAMTYSRRYGLASILGIATNEDDDGAGAGEPGQPRQKRQQQQQQQQKMPSELHDNAPCIQFKDAPNDEMKAFLIKWGYVWNGAKYRWEANPTEQSINTGRKILEKQSDMVKWHRGIEAEKPTEAPPADTTQSNEQGGDGVPTPAKTQRDAGIADAGGATDAPPAVDESPPEPTAMERKMAESAATPQDNNTQGDEPSEDAADTSSAVADGDVPTDPMDLIADITAMEQELGLTPRLRTTGRKHYCDATVLNESVGVDKLQAYHAYLANASG